MKNKALLTLAVLLCGLHAGAQETTITSPDGRIGMEVEYGSRLSYQVRFGNGTLIVLSPLCFEFVGEKPLGDSLIPTNKPDVKHGQVND